MILERNVFQAKYGHDLTDRIKSAEPLLREVGWGVSRRVLTDRSGNHFTIEMESSSR